MYRIHPHHVPTPLDHEFGWPLAPGLRGCSPQANCIQTDILENVFDALTMDYHLLPIPLRRLGRMHIVPKLAPKNKMSYSLNKKINFNGHICFLALAIALQFYI